MTLDCTILNIESRNNNNLITYCSQGNKLTPLSQKDLPRNLRSTRRLSTFNDQILAEFQQKKLQTSTNPDVVPDDQNILQVFQRQTAVVIPHYDNRNGVHLLEYTDALDCYDTPKMLILVFIDFRENQK